MHMSFRKLSQKEEYEFRRGAREHYEPLTEINGVWHPVYQDECVKINSEWSQVALLKGRARRNYESFTPINAVMPIVYQQECVLINMEEATYVEDSLVGEEDD